MGSSWLFLLILTPSFQPAVSVEKEGPLTVFVGGTLIEREIFDSHWETEITRRLPGQPVRFRNLGWSADTVYGQSRAVFGTPQDGYKKLVDHLQKIKPEKTVLAYGFNESFDGQAGLDPFIKGYEKLLLDAHLTRGLFFLTPNKYEPLPPPYPEGSKRNAQLAPYCQAIGQIASRKGATVIDMFQATGGEPRLTSNGIHFSPGGYYRTAPLVASGFGANENAWELNLDYSNGKARTQGVKVTPISSEKGTWRVEDSQLPRPKPPEECLRDPWARVVIIAGLSKGTFSLLIDGVEVGKGNAVDWAKGIAITRGPDLDQAERLRSTIREKNLQYFHRWRPQNETYLFGFRKHEQGQNAREIPQFDPIVASLEKEIHKLSKPVTRTYKVMEAR